MLLAAALRFHKLGAQSFWNDEGNSARLAERSVDLILAGAAGDIHPPGYYLLLAGWRAVMGASEFALRGLSALAGVVLVVLIYALGRRYYDTKAALYAAFLAAISPPLLYYSQEARMYELAALFGAAAMYVIRYWGLDSVPPTAKGWQGPVALALILAAGLYTHYAFAFVIIGLNLIFLIRIIQAFVADRTQVVSRWLDIFKTIYLPQAAALLLFAPWLPIAIRQVTSWPAGRAYPPLEQAIVGIAHWLTLGATIDNAIDSAMLIGLILLLGLSVWRKPALAPIVWVLVPATLTAVFGLFSPEFAKFLIVAVPPLCLLAGNGLALIRRPTDGPPETDPVKRTVRFVQPFILLPVLLPTLALPIAVSVNNLYNNPLYQRADYRAIDQYLDSIAKPGDAILLDAPNQWEVFTYYHTDLTNVFPVARSRPLNVPEQIAELESIAANHDRLFVLYWGDAQADPGRVIESWLNDHTFKAYDQWFKDVRLAAYAVPHTASAQQTKSNVQFGDRIMLQGYSLNAQTFAPGDILQLTLFWQLTPGDALTTRYKVFVHLVGDADQPPVAQHDGEPGGGLSLTTTWQPGQTVADNHGIYIPVDLAPGTYTLEVGLYGVDDNVRLTQPGGDALTLTTLTIQ